MKVLNAFSLSMLQDCYRATLDIEPTTLRGVQFELDLSPPEFFIGHASTHELVARRLGCGTIPPMRRESVKIKNGETVVIAQYLGPRLPEGATELPEGAKIEFFFVTARYTRPIPPPPRP